MKDKLEELNDVIQRLVQYVNNFHVQQNTTVGVLAHLLEIRYDVLRTLPTDTRPYIANAVVCTCVHSLG